MDGFLYLLSDPAARDQLLHAAQLSQCGLSDVPPLPRRSVPAASILPSRLDAVQLASRPRAPRTAEHNVTEPGRDGS
jgi:hypothetical protein